MTDIQIVRSGGFRNQSVDAGSVFGVENIRAGDVGQTGISTGPVLIPAAPSFPGMDYAQFIPANLVLDGTLALNDPIDSLPLYGDLIPGGAFTAAGSARPIVADDGTGRVGMSMDGVDDMPEITGLSLDLTGGCTVYFVFRRDAGLGGLLRGDAGNPAADKSRIEMYSNSGGSGNFNQVISANREAGLTFVQAPTAIPFGEVHSICGVWSNANATRGIYRDGAKIGTNAPAPPAVAIQNMQIAGYSNVKFNGFLYTEVIYNGVHDTAERAVVDAYLRDKFNGGASFFEEP